MIFPCQRTISYWFSVKPPNQFSHCFYLISGANHGLWKNNSNFFHKGINRRWQGVLTEDQIHQYDDMARERLSPDLAMWLASGNQVETM